MTLPGCCLVGVLEREKVEGCVRLDKGGRGTGRGRATDGHAFVVACDRFRFWLEEEKKKKVCAMRDSNKETKDN